MKLSTTLNLLHKADACTSRYKVLVTALGNEYPKDKEINLLTILESNGLDDALWTMCATVENCEKVARLMAADFAEESLKYWNKFYPKDNRPKQAIKAARDFANELISKEELNAAADAAYDAADAAYADAATAAADAADAAYDAADAAYADAAAAAAWSAAAAAWSAAAATAAADAAAWSAARLKQTEIFVKYLSE
jgi:hypothetical protein